MTGPASEHERCSEMLAPYLLHALSADERAAVEHHLRDCRRCRREVAELQPAADVLPETVPALDPPADLKAGIMRTVHSEAALLRSAGPEADRAPRRRRGLGRALRARILVPVAAAAAAVGAVVIVANTGPADRGEPRVIAAAITDPRLTSRATASVRLTGERASLLVQDLPDPPRRHVYQVWVKPPARPPQPAGATFAVRSGSIEIPRPVRRGDQVMVSVEPAGGSPAPTRAPLIVARPA